MTNKEIANTFNRLAKIMELHDENPFKIRSYNTAYNTLRRLDTPLSDMPTEEIAEIKGIGKAIQDKIAELLGTGELATYNKYADVTPPGIIHMLSIRGLGPKKLKTLWNQLEIESPGELLYACNENRLVELKGFGEKTQDAIRNQLEYFFETKDSFLFGHVYHDAKELCQLMREKYPSHLFDLIGEIRRKSNVVSSIEILSTLDQSELEWVQGISNEHFVNTEEGLRYYSYPVLIESTNSEMFYLKSVLLSSSDDFGEQLASEVELDESYESVDDVFIKNELPVIPEEMWEDGEILDLDTAPDLVNTEDIKGVVHCHSTYSDGSVSLKDLAAEVRSRGFEYMLITDHSQSAFYANGLKPDQVKEQWEEIDNLNAAWDDFKIFKGIESDILSDGSLDYKEDMLAGFDVIIGSIHSNLKMDEKKATQRLLKAIENPYMKMLGHPTGRLLLSREGYPVDFEEIIAACAEHGVVIEMNANPHRLDMDWEWVPVATNQGVAISINPDSHNKGGLDDIEYGIYSARKGGLTKEMCLNTKGAKDFEAWFLA